jgi:hypothetical protein
MQEGRAPDFVHRTPAAHSGCGQHFDLAAAERDAAEAGAFIFMKARDDGSSCKSRGVAFF